MADYKGPYNYAAIEEVNPGEVNYSAIEEVNPREVSYSAVEEANDVDGHEEWSWMHNTRTDDNTANAAEEEYYSENYDIVYEAEDSSCCESSQQVVTTSGYNYRQVRSASGGHTGVLLEDDQVSSSRGSEDDEHVEVKTGEPETKKKGVFRRFVHLQEPSLDTHSDPGYGDMSYEIPNYDRNHIDLVSDWLQEARPAEYLQDGFEAPHYAHYSLARRPPPRRHHPGMDMVTRSASLPNEQAVSRYDHYEPNPAGMYYNNRTLPCDPVYGYSCYPEVQYEDNQFANYDRSVSLAPQSIYCLEEKKPLDKALKLMKIGVVGFASVSKTAAVALKDKSSSVSKTAAVAFKEKSIELKKLAIPVMKPIFDAVLEESKEQLLGPVYPVRRPNSMAPDPMVTPNAPARGRGRAKRGPMPRSLQRPPMLMAPGQRPVMRPGMPAGPRPVMKPGMRSGMPPPQGAVLPTAAPAARGQGVAMRGQPRPRGRARAVEPIDPHQQSW